MAITQEELITWATRNGWKLDHWGHLKKEFDGRLRRVKLSRIAARYEFSTPYGWVRLSSGYLKNLSIDADGRLTGLTPLFPSLNIQYIGGQVAGIGNDR